MITGQNCVILKRLLRIFSCGSLFFAASRWYSAPYDVNRWTLLHHITIFLFDDFVLLLRGKKTFGRLIPRVLFPLLGQANRCSPLNTTNAREIHAAFGDEDGDAMV